MGVCLLGGSGRVYGSVFAWWEWVGVFFLILITVVFVLCCFLSSTLRCIFNV